MCYIVWGKVHTFEREGPNWQNWLSPKLLSTDYHENVESFGVGVDLYGVEYRVPFNW